MIKGNGILLSIGTLIIISSFLQFQVNSKATHTQSIETVLDNLQETLLESPTLQYFVLRNLLRDPLILMGLMVMKNGGSEKDLIPLMYASGEASTMPLMFLTQSKDNNFGDNPILSMMIMSSMQKHKKSIDPLLMMMLMQKPGYFYNKKDEDLEKDKVGKVEDGLEADEEDTEKQ